MSQTEIARRRAEIAEAKRLARKAFLCACRHEACERQAYFLGLEARFLREAGIK